MRKTLATLHTLTTATLIAGATSIAISQPPILNVTATVPPGHCVPATNNNWCAPVNHPHVVHVKRMLEQTGHTCSSEPRLTDRIVFQHRDYSVEVLTFDEAWEADGWAQAFCA